jgi:hypothetical protein
LYAITNILLLFFFNSGNKNIGLEAFQFKVFMLDPWGRGITAKKTWVQIPRLQTKWDESKDLTVHWKKKRNTSNQKIGRILNFFLQ